MERVSADRRSTQGTGDPASGMMPSQPALVFVHGWGGHGRFWQPQITGFADNFAVTAPDLAGHGAMQNSQGEFSVNRFAADIADLVAAMAVSQCTLIGHSMGGAVALEAARRVPARIERVVLVDAFVMDWGRLEEAVINGFLSTFRENFPAAVRGLIEQTCTPDTDPGVIARAAEVMCTLAPEVGLPALESLLRWDPLPTFQALSTPVHCINGSLVDAAARERYAPFVTEHVVPGAGHYLQLEDEAGFTQLLASILASG